MAYISLRQVLDHAAEHGYGVPAFNVNNLEQIHAIMEAAQETQSPVILQASAGARKYAGEPYLRHLVKPERIDCWHTAGDAPWSWWSTTGTSGWASTAASTKCRR